MMYELWDGNRLLGQSDLAFPAMSKVTFVGEFFAHADAENAVEVLAVSMPCLHCWMNRKQIGPNGRHLIKRSFRESRLLAAISEIVPTLQRPGFQLRRPDGTVVPVRTFILQSYSGRKPQKKRLDALLHEAMYATDDEDESRERFSFVSPEAAALFWQSVAEDEEDSRFHDAWRGDSHLDASEEHTLGDDEQPYDVKPPYRTPRFQLHVEIEREGDIPADTSWLED